MAHQDWRGLAAWVRSLPLERTTDLVNEEGTLFRISVSVEKTLEKPWKNSVSLGGLTLWALAGAGGIDLRGLADF